MFNWEYDIALYEMKGNQASSPGEWYVSWCFSSCGRNLGYILKLKRGWPFETPLCSAKSGLLSSYGGHLRNLSKLESIIQTLLVVRWETKRPFLVCTVILGFLSIFKKSHASSPFEAFTPGDSQGVKGCEGPWPDESGN